MAEVALKDCSDTTAWEGLWYDSSKHFTTDRINFCGQLLLTVQSISFFSQQNLDCFWFKGEKGTFRSRNKEMKNVLWETITENKESRRVNSYRERQRIDGWTQSGSGGSLKLSQCRNIYGSCVGLISKNGQKWAKNSHLGHFCLQCELASDFSKTFRCSEFESLFIFDRDSVLL